METPKTTTTKERLMFGYINQFTRSGYSRCGQEMADAISQYWRLMYDIGFTDTLWGVRLSVDSLTSNDEKYESYIIE